MNIFVRNWSNLKLRFHRMIDFLRLFINDNQIFKR